MMTKLAAVVSLLAAGAFAADNNNSTQVNSTVLNELAQTFESLGYTQLATYAATIVNTTVGNRLLATITNGNDNYTIFAPTDSAISSGNQSSFSDSDNLADIISYHVVPGYYGNSSAFYSSPNNTIIRTFLNSTDYVTLQGNSSQVLSATLKKGKVVINNQNGTVSVGNVTTSGRFSILGIDKVLTPPKSLSDVLSDNNLTQFTSAAQSAGLLDGLESAHGITIFAPTDSAISAAISKLGANATNETLIETILQNHIINGTTVYSTQLDDKNQTSAAGEALKFWVYNNTITVYSGSNNNITANVTTRDLLTSNGVVHIVNAVLLNEDRDDGAASSAYSSATSAASNTATGTSSTGAVGGNPSGSPNGAFMLAPTQFGVAIGAAVFGVLLGAVSL